VHDTLVSWGHEAKMIDTTRVRAMGVGHHKRKNDAMDAEVAARAVDEGRIPVAHVLSPERRSLRAQLSVRRDIRLHDFVVTRHRSRPRLALSIRDGRVRSKIDGSAEQGGRWGNASRDLAFVAWQVELKVRRFASREPTAPRRRSTQVTVEGPRAHSPPDFTIATSH
jgi:hypothetical protein